MKETEVTLSSVLHCILDIFIVCKCSNVTEMWHACSYTVYLYIIISYIIKIEIWLDL